MIDLIFKHYCMWFKMFLLRFLKFIPSFPHVSGRWRCNAMNVNELV